MAVKTYSVKKNAKTYLSKANPILMSNEVACKDGTDKYLWDTDLTTNIVKTFNAVKLFKGYESVFKIIIVSGYRTASHNKAVGGATGSKHTQGKAVDFYLVYKDSKGKEQKVPSKIVCCAGQIADSKGIEKITDYNVHLDVGRATKWYARKSGSSYPLIPNNDFFAYCKVTRPKLKSLSSKKYYKKDSSKVSAQVKQFKKGTTSGGITGIKVRGTKHTNIWYKTSTGWLHKSNTKLA